MKKLLVGLMILVALGCTGLNAGVAVSIATDTAFVLALQNNQSYKPAVVQGLTDIKAVLAGTITYDELVALIATKLPGKYAPIALILSSYIATDKPLFETYLPMLESYKQPIIDKIDRFILLAKV